MTRTADLEAPPSPNGKEIFTPRDRAAWRAWLDTNHARPNGLWIVYRKQSSALLGPDYDDLVEEALCFGWIDSQLRRVDADRAMQWFSPRRRGGPWAATNKARIARLAEAGLITDAGWAAIDAGKASGLWALTAEIDALIVPPDLEAALEATPAARDGYLALPDSTKRQHLWWIQSAKQTQTRAGRIATLIDLLTGDTPPTP